MTLEKHFSPHHRVPLLIAACAVLCLAVVRCSPIAPSMSKYRLVPIPLSPIGGGITGTDFSSRTTVTQTQDSRLIGVRAYVLDFGRYESAINELPVTQQLTLSPLNSPREFETFRENGSVLIRFTENTPDECRVYLGLGQSRILVEGRDSGTITMDCTQVSDKTWRIAVSSSVSQIDREWLKSHLQSVTIQGTGTAIEAPAPAIGAIDQSTDSTDLPQTATVTQGDANNAATPERDDNSSPQAP